MNKFKKGITAIMSVICVFLIAGCGCSDEGQTERRETVVESPVSGGEVMNELWAGDLDKSAEVIDSYHAVSVDEVLSIWKQAHMQKNDQGIVNGNGALIYGICSPDLRDDCLEEIKKIGLWNFYYSQALGMPDQTRVPQGMVFSKPERYSDDEGIHYDVEVNEITYSGETESYVLRIEYISGGYYLAGKTDLKIAE